MHAVERGPHAAPSSYRPPTTTSAPERSEVRLGVADDQPLRHTGVGEPPRDAATEGTGRAGHRDQTTDRARDRLAATRASCA